MVQLLLPELLFPEACTLSFPWMLFPELSPKLNFPKSDWLLCNEGDTLGDMVRCKGGVGDWL